MGRGVGITEVDRRKHRRTAKQSYNPIVPTKVENCMAPARGDHRIHRGKREAGQSFLQILPESQPARVLQEHCQDLEGLFLQFYLRTLASPTCPQINIENSKVKGGVVADHRRSPQLRRSLARELQWTRWPRRLSNQSVESVRKDVETLHWKVR